MSPRGNANVNGCFAVALGAPGSVRLNSFRISKMALKPSKGYDPIFKILTPEYLVITQAFIFQAEKYIYAMRSTLQCRERGQGWSKGSKLGATTHVTWFYSAKGRV